MLRTRGHSRAGKEPRLLIVSSEAARPKNNYDALRLLMALLVIWSHSFAIHLGSEDREWLSLLLHGVYNAGNLGVMAFFIISGYLIAQSWERSSSGRSYFAKRIRRIYPGYMVATTISGVAFVIMLAPTWSWVGFVKATVLNLFLRNQAPAFDCQGEDTVTALNGALWSIPFEFWCYIGVAALGVIGLTRRKWSLVAILVAIMIAHVALDLTGRKPGLGIIGEIFGWPYLWTKMAPCFLLGMVAYAFKDSLRRSAWLLTAFLVAAVAGCWVNPDLGYLLVSPALAYAVFFIAYADVALHGAARYGDLSYGTYLYGFLIQRILQATVADGWTIWVFFAVSAVLSLAAGFCSWHLVEKHWQTKRPDVQMVGSLHSAVFHWKGRSDGFLPRVADQD